MSNQIMLRLKSIIVFCHRSSPLLASYMYIYMCMYVRMPQQVCEDLTSCTWAGVKIYVHASMADVISLSHKLSRVCEYIRTLRLGKRTREIMKGYKEGGREAFSYNGWMYSIRGNIH